MMPHAFILAFVPLGLGDGADASEHGEVRARSCAAAEQYVRDGLRHGQRVIIVSCEPIKENHRGAT